MRLTVERFARDTATVCTLRTLIAFARTGRPDQRTMASWGLTEAEFFEGLSMALAISFSTSGQAA